MSSKRSPESFLPLPLHESHILISLLDSPKHGYGIMQEVNERVGTATFLAPASLYRSIKLLCNGELIREVHSITNDSADARRRYYVITDLGIRVVSAEMERMKFMIQLMDRKLRHMKL